MSVGPIDAGRAFARPTMTTTIEISDDLRNRLESHLEEGEEIEEFIEELVSIYETEGTFLQEGY